ncbi:DUF4013 domain-containing protein [Halopiger djelfimassiliensis]|uniref:DUF4013 domain-containing protein n=1 Tax=Halopiger djelfimassiliensis TaxID=1293047 RepID=UPI0006781E21|nr:DUF4013 domain-containing protein [Halopiger djelfimassiliensis]
MFADVLSYPNRGAWLERTVLGSLLVVGSVLVVPAVFLAGYLLRVLETTLDGDDTPPPFEGWRELAAAGAGGTAITLAYLLAPLVGGAIVTLVLVPIGYYGLVGLATVIDGRVAIWGVSLVAALVAGLLALGFAAVTLAVYTVLPAALTVYARTGALRSAFDRTALEPIVLCREYVLAVTVLQLVPLAVPIVALCCLVTVVGVVALPAIPFYAALVSCRVLGVATSAAIDRPIE